MFYIYFGLSSILTFILLSSRWRWIWRLTTSALVWSIGAYLLHSINSGVGGLGPVSKGSPWKVDGVLFLGLILGMAAKYMWDRLAVSTVEC